MRAPTRCCGARRRHWQSNAGSSPRPLRRPIRPLPVCAAWPGMRARHGNSRTRRCYRYPAAYFVLCRRGLDGLVLDPRWRVLRRCFLHCLLVLVAVDASGAQAVVRQERAADPLSTRSGTWSATTRGGLTLMGTWTAVPGSTSGTVTGTWTLVDAEGRTLANGGWGAAKSPTRWTGAWRAAISGRSGEYSGTWNAGLDLKGDAPFIDLFEKAAQSVVSGNWRAGRQSGAWSVQAPKREGAP